LPFGAPWTGVTCEEESGPTAAYFHIPRGDATDKDFFRLPFPNDVRRSSTSLDLSGFPTPGDQLLGYDFVQRYVDAVESARDGWGVHQAVAFRFSGLLDSDTFQGNVKLVNLTDGQSLGLYYGYAVGRSNYLCGNSVIVAPPAGYALEPGKTYAVYFTVGLKADGGGDIERPADLVALLDSAMPSDAAVVPHWTKYQPLRDYLAANNINPLGVLNASVFTVGTPRALVEQLQGVIDGLGPAQASQWTLCDTGVSSPCPDATGERACGAADPDFHELHALVTLPIFQQGTPPYLTPSDGGALHTTGSAPSVDHTEQVCLSLTVPKGAPPPVGWPTVVFAHGTGGHFRSHIVAGISAALAQGVDDGTTNVVKAAVVGIDQVMHGPRRAGSTLTPHDLFFNYENPNAALGNPQQGAADQMSLLRFVPSVSFTLASSPTGEAFSLASTVAFWGHSQGATLGAIATPYADWMGVVFSGQGASLKDSLVTKTSPVNIAGIMPIALQDIDGEGELPYDQRHPVLNLLQQHIDGGDPLAYGRLLAAAPPSGMAARHVLQLYGLNDTYTPGRVQQIYALVSLLGLAAHDSSVLVPDAIGNLSEFAVPASGNLTINTKVVSAFVRQYESNNDGHFVVFDVPSAQGDALRFLAGSLRGVAPIVGQ
jgi:hypothetical protein